MVINSNDRGDGSLFGITKKKRIGLMVLFAFFFLQNFLINLATSCSRHQKLIILLLVT